MPKEWTEMELGAFVELVYGRALPASARRPGAVPVYGSAGVIGWHDEAIVSGPGVVVGRKGNVGAVHWSDLSFWPIDTTFIVKTSESLEFVYYLLQDVPFVNAHAAVPGVSRDQAYRLRVQLPKRAYQDRVAQCLRLIDDLVNNLGRQVALLERAGAAIFRAWFIEGRLAGIARPGQRKTRLLGELIELAYGKALKESNRAGGDVAVYGSSGIIGWHDVPLVAGPGIVVGRKGNVGSVFWSDRDFYPIDTTYFVRTELPLLFVYHMLKTLHFVDSHAAVPGLSRDHAYAIEVDVPPVRAMDAFKEFVQPFFEVRAVVNALAKRLGALMGHLRPVLMTGQLDVSALEVNRPQQ